MYVRELQRLLSLEFFEDPDRTPLEYPLECQPNEIIAYNPHISRVQRMMPNRRPNSGRKANVGRRSSPVRREAYCPESQYHNITHLHRQKLPAYESKMSNNFKIRGIRSYNNRRKIGIHPPVFNSDDDWTQFGGLFSVKPS